MHSFSSKVSGFSSPLPVNLRLYSTTSKLLNKTSQKGGPGKIFFERFLKLAQWAIQFQINSFNTICYQSSVLYKVDRQKLGLTIPSNPGVMAPAHQNPDGAMPASVQELLHELRSRRQRVIDLLTSVDELKAQNEKLRTDYVLLEKEKTLALNAEEKIKGSFQSVDQKFLDLRNEVLNLRETQSKYTDLLEKHQELKLKNEKSATGRLSQSEEKRLQCLLEERREEMDRLEKRLERLRNQSPPMVALQKVFSSLTQTSTGRYEILHEAFVAMQKKYATVLTENFPSHSEMVGAREVLVQGCMEYVRSSFAFSAFDCVISCPIGIDKELSKYLKELCDSGFVVRRLSNTSVEISCPERKDCMGPYGVMACFMHAYPEKAKRLIVYPTISARTIEKRAKVTIAHETCKSSKPGGQASNVTETQVKSALTFNGQVVARASSQDTRSQHENMKRADQRLIEESLDSEIRKWRVSPPQLKQIDVQSVDMAALQCLFETSNFRDNLYLFGVLRQV